MLQEFMNLTKRNEKCHKSVKMLIGSLLKKLKKQHSQFKFTAAFTTEIGIFKNLKLTHLKNVL